MNIHAPSHNFEKIHSKAISPLKNKSRGYDLRSIAKEFETNKAFSKARADIILFEKLANDGLNETR